MPIDEYRPWVSENVRIDPKAVREANEMLKHRGVQNAGFDDKGRAVAHSNKGRNEILKFMGYRDNDAGYGQHNGR